MRKLHSLLAFGILVLAGCGGEGSDGIPTVAILNYLSHPILDESVAGIKEGLAAHGYAGDRIRILETNANGEYDKVYSLTQELLSASPDVFVPVATTPAQIAFTLALPSQQVVFSTVTNPWDIGFDSQPENWTGVSDLVNYAANIDLIFSLYPDTKRVGMVYNPSESNSQYGVDRVQELASERGFELLLAPVSTVVEVRDAAALLAEQVDVLYVGSDNTVVSGIAALLSAAAERRKPVVSSDAGSVSEGVPIAVSVDYRALGRRVGEIVAELLSTGKRAGDVAMVQYLGDKIVTNAQGAALLGMSLPDSLLTSSR